MMEQIKIGLLAVIAVALGIQIYMQSTESGNSSSSASTTETTTFQTPNPIPTTTPPINPTNIPVDGGAAAQDQTTVSFSETNFDMGTLSAGEKVRHTFEVTNTGSNPLKLESLNADPGLTVISYTNQEIPPGETGQIEVELNTEGMAGSQTKRIHVNSNSNPGHVHLNITADVQ